MPGMPAGYGQSCPITKVSEIFAVRWTPLILRTTVLQNQSVGGRTFPETLRRRPKGSESMPTITTQDGTEIFYKDWGTGRPIVFSHGWPLSADDWETQMLFFLNKGFRVIAHDRRGHGRSTQTSGS